MAWLKIHTGRCDVAIELLLRATQLAKKNYDKAKGLAFCFFRHRALQAAKVQLDYMASLGRPPERDVTLLRAEVLESRGEYRQAVAALKAAYSLDLDPNVHARLRAMRKQAESMPVTEEISSRNFVLQYRPEDLALAEKLLDRLDKHLDRLVLD